MKTFCVTVKVRPVNLHDRGEKEAVVTACGKQLADNCINRAVPNIKLGFKLSHLLLTSLCSADEEVVLCWRENHNGFS